MLPLALTLLALGGSPQQADTLRLDRLTGPVTFDGLVDEPAWAAVPPLPMTTYTPTFGQPITERTEIRVGYDDAYLYLAGRMYDSRPREVRTNTLYRDAYSGDDLVAIVLDTYDDHQTASWFVVNPAGVRNDRAVSNDAEFSGGGNAMNSDWNTFWDAATARSDSGWSAEMRIPFTSLGFQDLNGRVVMGMIVYRFVARKNERQIYPAIPPNWGLGFAKPSQARRVVLEGVYRRRPVYVMPYGLGGLRRDAALAGQDKTGEAGLDVRYSPFSNLALDFSVNTDFAQVEADDQQVNLTRFSLFFPEKRQFFQSRAAVFELGLGGNDRLFHSRAIGLADDQPVRLLGGVRAVGRAGRWDVGALNMQTARRDTFPSENVGVARLKRQILNPYSTLGAMVTTRVGDDGSYNVAAGVDAVIRTVGDEYLTLKVARTFDSDYQGLSLGDPDATRLFARWERRNERGLSYSAQLIRSGAFFESGLGFTERRDFTSLEPQAQYLWFGGPTSPFRYLGPTLSLGVVRRNADGTVETGGIEPGFSIELKGGAQITGGVRRSYESVTAGVDLDGGVSVPAGEYWFHAASVRYQASRAGTFRPTWSASAGQFFDGTLVSLEVNPAWNPSRHLELGLDYTFNAVRFAERDQAANIHLARVRIQAAYDIHLTLATFAQYNSAADAASVNARLRYNFREGTDLWIVYNEGLNTSRPRVTPRLPLSQARAVMVKYSHAFIW